MVKELVGRELSGRVATLALSRPDQRNALNRDLVQALKDALQETADDADVRVVVLTGAGSAFSAGADLKALEAMQTASREENLADSRHLAELFEALYRHPKPIIGKINGHAIGGGCGLAAVCDVAFAADDAKMGFTEVRLGFIPAIVMIFVLRKIGETATRDLMLSGRIITAGEAAEAGLVKQAVPPGQLDNTVAAYADILASETSGAAVASTKEMLARIGDLSFADALDYAVASNAAARSTDDCRAGIKAFLRKEPPPWKR